MRGVTTWAMGLLLLGALPAAAEPATWEFRDNRWQQVSVRAAAVSQPAAEPTLDRAQELLEGRQGSAARHILIRWLKTNRSHPARDRALYLTARAMEQTSERIKAFYYCDELMDTYPESLYFGRALQLQYDVADAFLNGAKQRFLGMAILDAEDEAVEMLYRIQGRSPGSPLAERALLRTADYYYASSQFDLAADAYSVYARNYPRSPLVPRVRLRQAYANYALFKGLKFDASPLIDARAQLGDLIHAYPKLAQEENLPALVEQIDRTFARKIYLTGDFYRRTHEPRAAAYLYRLLAATYPNSREAELARQDLTTLPQWALDIPAPNAGANFAPTSRPMENP